MATNRISFFIAMVIAFVSISLQIDHVRSDSDDSIRFHPRLVSQDNANSDEKLEDIHNTLDCDNDDDCEDDEICTDTNQCIRLCDINECGLHATCVTEAHLYGCICPEGTTGDPNDRCLKMTCNNDKDCEWDETCDDNRCVDGISVR